MIGHRLKGASLLSVGNIAEGRLHFDQGIALYDPAEHRPLATHFGVDSRVSILSFRSLALWLLGYPEAALADTDHALKDAREIGQAATLIYALGLAAVPHTLWRNRAVAAAQSQELVGLAEEKGALLWKAFGMMYQGSVLALAGRASDATEMLIPGIGAYQATGAKTWIPFYLQHLAGTHAYLGQFDEAWRCIGEAVTAMETTKEKWCEADIHRTAGEITLMSPEHDAAKAEAHFERALAVACKQKAGSCARRRVWLDCGAIRANGSRPATSLRRSTAGSPQALIRLI
jgi:predicted ATPase